VGHRYAELVYYGLWFTPLREALEAFVAKTQEQVTGSVRLKLYKGNCTVVGRKSPFSLYREDFATFGKDNVYDQRDAVFRFQPGPVFANLLLADGTEMGLALVQDPKTEFKSFWTLVIGTPM
jgi:hypothetical protein